MSAVHEVELLEKFKKHAIAAGVVEIEVCMGCGKENCDSCPCGTGFRVVNRKAERLMKFLSSIGIEKLDIDKWEKDHKGNKDD